VPHAGRARASVSTSAAPETPQPRQRDGVLERLLSFLLANGVAGIGRPDSKVRGCVDSAPPERVGAA
jgi:hypothetical protein